MSKNENIVTPSDEEVAQYGGAADPAQEVSPEATPPAEQPAQPAAEGEEWREKFLRARAELSNYQKRAEKDRLETLKFAAADLVRGLLPVLDDLDRIIAAGVDGSAEAIVEGVKMTRHNFLKILSTFNVTPIEAEGREFNPELHEAVMQQPAEGATEPRVLQEVSRGYRMHDRVLRPSKVIVSKPA